MANTEKKKFQFKMPHTYVILRLRRCADRQGTV